MMDENTEKVFSELEKTQKDFWNISRQTANFLNMLIKMLNIKNVLEIGTSNGYSGIWLAKALKTTGGHLTTIEFYEKRINLATENFKTCGVDDIITVRQGSAIGILENLPQDTTLDMVFIDANKGEYIKYFDLLDPFIKKGGVIAADNVLSHAEKVKPFVEKISNDERYQSQVLDLPAGLLLAYKL